MTAIAAVLALSSTPLVAQETTTPPDPVTETPSNPPPVADPLAPAAVAERCRGQRTVRWLHSRSEYQSELT